MAVEVGHVVDGRYVLKRQISEGGMSRVFEAEHRFSHARVALKILLPGLLDDKRARARLEREARAIASSRHRNVVALFDAGVCLSAGPYVVLEMLDGRSLDSLIVARQRLKLGDAVAILGQVCAALGAAHRGGIVHRDVKPSNVIIGPGGPEGDRAWLIDFGIAQVDATVEVEDTKLTAPGTLLGTAAYMAPEQLTAMRPVDARADVWSAAVMFYECVTGEVPIPGQNVRLTGKTLAEAVAPAVLACFDDVLARALSIQADSRHASAAELAQALAAALGEPVPTLALLSGFTSPDAVTRSLRPTVEEGPGRRRFARVPYSAPIRVLHQRGSLDGRTEDLSEGGVLVVVGENDVCNDGEHVQIRLPLPTTGKIALLSAVARWTRTRRGLAAIGLEFETPPDPVRDEIKGFVELMARLQRP